MGSASALMVHPSKPREAALVKRVLLVGFMASGKSTVGRSLAVRLGWDFVDFDEEIEQRTGASVREIFRTRGEPAFRDLEAQVARDLLTRENVVLASGGGWPARPNRLETLDASTLTVWLDVSAETAVERSSGEVGARPLLSVADPVGEARRLVSERRAFYSLAELHLDSETSSSGELAERIAEHIHSRTHSATGN
jgi:shikimate kinase